MANYRTRTATIDLTNSIDFYDITFSDQQFGSTTSTGKTFDISSAGFTVANVIDITDDIVLLSSNQITVDNSNPTAIQRTTGQIRGETTSIAGLSSIQWNIGTSSTGSYEFPFGTFAGVYIPFIFNVTAGGSESGGTGAIIAATYPTGAANTPFPTGVTHIDNASGGNNSAFVADRFWIISPMNFSR